MHWHRAYLAFRVLERTLPAEGEARAAAAGRLCRAMGAMRSSADEADTEGLTPLKRAAADGAVVGVLRRRCLAAASADVNRREAAEVRTALFLAADNGQAGAVEALARLGGDKDATAYRGVFDATPMRIAASDGHAAVIKALGRLGADVNRAYAAYTLPCTRQRTRAGHTAAIEALASSGRA